MNIKHQSSGTANIMDIKLLLLLNCAIVANYCQSTISDKDDATYYEQQLFGDDTKSEMELMRRVLMDLKETVVRNEVQTRQQLKSEIDKLQDVFAQQQYWSRNECPPGFEYSSDAGSCYKAIFERMTWDAATERCRQLMPGVHLATITSETENNAIVKYLQSKFRGNSNLCTQVGGKWPEAGNLIWIGGQTRNAIRCGDKLDYVWKPLKGIEIPLNYDNWNPKYPDCNEGGENCLQINTGFNYTWNDYNCTWLSCAICELHVHV